MAVCSRRKRSYDESASESEYESGESSNNESSPDGRSKGKSKISLHRRDDDSSKRTKSCRDMTEQERKEEQQRRMQEALAPEDNLELKVMKAMGAMEEGDAVFGSAAEVSFDSQVYWLHHKYRLRKPKYFNRVHTGYDWNKYNRTHYDHDHPPPKFVQGYKSNIFYPDLVDKTKAPVYTFDNDGNNAETCITRFHAGSPYQDIAFRIVNNEWEYSPKNGFKCSFERGILQLYFNFKRHHYRS